MGFLFGFKGILGVDRSSRLKVLCKIGFLKNFADFTGNHLYGSLCFNKVAARTFGFVEKFFTFFSPKLKPAFVELFWS